ncbi:rhomboid family intramembrane serine protease, partial [archaeon]
LVLSGGFATAKVNPMLGPRPEALVDSGAKVTPLMYEQQQWWRLITPVWLHAGLVHFLSNMFTLWRTAADFERSVGGMACSCAARVLTRVHACAPGTQALVLRITACTFAIGRGCSCALCGHLLRLRRGVHDVLHHPGAALRDCWCKRRSLWRRGRHVC